MLLSLHIQIPVSSCSRPGMITGGLKCLRQLVTEFKQLFSYQKDIYSTLPQLFHCSKGFRWVITDNKFRLNKNLHFIDFGNGFGQWQLQLPPKFCSRPEGPKQILTKIFFNKWFLQTFAYLEIRFMLFKIAGRS